MEELTKSDRLKILRDDEISAMSRRIREMEREREDQNSTIEKLRSEIRALRAGKARKG